MEENDEKKPYKPFSGSIFGRKGSLVSFIFLVIMGALIAFFENSNSSRTEEAEEKNIATQDSLLIDSTETKPAKHEN